MNGVLYLAVGEKYRTESLNSIQSIREVGYQGPIKIVIDAYDKRFSKFDVECHILYANPSSELSREVKTNLYNYTSYDRTLYMDTDTLIIESIDSAWKLPGSILLALDSIPTLGAFYQRLVDNDEKVDRELSFALAVSGPFSPYHNSGVIIFDKCAETRDLFLIWNKIWRRWRRQDQRALAVAIKLSGARITRLDRCWNQYKTSAIKNIHDAIEQRVKILHLWQSDRQFIAPFAKMLMEYREARSQPENQ